MIDTSGRSHKRTQHIDNDGWTQVTGRNRRRQEAPAHMNTTHRPHRNPPSQHMTPSKVREDFDRKMKTWQASSCRKSTFSSLDRVRPEGGFNIDRAVCLGSGSFSRDNLECRRRSMWQLVVFVDLVKGLASHQSSRSIAMYVQEPEFTEVDTTFLNSMGCQVLWPDKAEPCLESVKEHIGQTAVLFEPFMDMNEAMIRYLIEADVKLYVGSSIKGLMNRSGEVGKLAKKFDTGRKKFYLPLFDVDPNVLDGIGIYWRDETEDD